MSSVVILCIAVVSPSNSPLWVGVYGEDDAALRLHTIVHSSLDVTDERLAASKKSTVWTL